jgi:predicted GIY-YIG superfamily endonuclease
MRYGQSAAKVLNIEELLSIQEQSSTTIPQGSRLLEYLKVETPDIIFKNIFSDCLEKDSCIYMLINIKTFNCYIGSTRNLQNRLRKHRRSLRYKHYNYKFTKIKEHKDFFYYSILETTSDLEKRELSYIRYYKNNFNDLLLNISTDTQRNFTHNGLWQSVISKKNERASKPIFCYDLSGNFIKKYKSISQASNELSLPRSNIKLCIKDKVRFLQTYTFRDFYKKKIEIRKSKRGLIALRNIESMKKKIKCLETNIIYESISEAERQLNLPRGNIFSCLKRKGKYKNKYTFEYYKDIV